MFTCFLNFYPELHTLQSRKAFGFILQRNFTKDMFILVSQATKYQKDLHRRLFQLLNHFTWTQKNSGLLQASTYIFLIKWAQHIFFIDTRNIFSSVSLLRQSVEEQIPNEFNQFTTNVGSQIKCFKPSIAELLV